MAEKGKGEAAYLGTLESARARAQSRMIQAILEGFQSLTPDRVTPEVVRDLRYIEALEKMADDTTARVLFPYGPSLTDIEQISRQVTAAPAGGSPNGAGIGDKPIAAGSAKEAASQLVRLLHTKGLRSAGKKARDSSK